MAKKFNDKTNPQVVMVAYMAPTKIHLAVAKAWNFKPINTLAVLLDRAKIEFKLIEVTS